MSSDLDSPPTEEQAAPLAERSTSADEGSEADDVDGRRTEPDASAAETEEPPTTLPTPPEASDEAAPQEETEDKQPAQADPAAPVGRLRVTSSPPGAQVFIDDEEAGETPLTLPGVPVGSYRVEVRRDGYKPYSETARVEENGLLTISPALEPLTGTLRISARPWGQLFINGEQQSAELTRAEVFELPVGSHTIRVEHPELGAWQRDIALAGEETTELQVDLTQAYDVTVGVFDEEGKALPRNIVAEVFLDGESVGNAPKRVSVPAGLHRFDVRAEGYTLAEPLPPINVEANQTLRIRLRKDDS